MVIVQNTKNKYNVDTNDRNNINSTDKSNIKKITKNAKSFDNLEIFNKVIL
jgi:hypothetical protein